MSSKHFDYKAATVVTSLAVVFLLINTGCRSYHDRLAAKKDVVSYEEVGRLWGEQMKRWKEKNPDKTINNSFIEFLLVSKTEGLTGRSSTTGNDLESEKFARNIYMIVGNNPKARPSYYFNVHTSLKNAFQKGFQTGFVDRNADMVLGPHITRAAKILAAVNAYRFKFNMEEYAKSQDILIKAMRDSFGKANIVQNTQNQIDATIESSVELFKELIAEGSPADREEFRENFKRMYKGGPQHYLDTTTDDVDDYIVISTLTELGHQSKVQSKSKLFDEGVCSISSSGVYDAKLELADAEAMWKYIYKRSVIGVGHEMGAKSRHNLIKRNDLVDWLRRALIALDDYDTQKNWISEGFANAYKEAGSEKMGQDVFESLLEDTGLNNRQ